MTFTFPSHIIAIPIVVGVIALLVALVGGLKFKNIPVVLIGLFFAFNALGLFAPMMWLDRVVLDEQKLEQTTGFWFAPTVKGFEYDEVTSVTITTEITPKGLENDIWLVHYQDGRRERIDPGDLWAMNTDEIVPRLEQEGIVVVRN